MDITEKINLISRPPIEEVVTEEELLELLKTNSNPKHYIGIEISGFLHLGSLISTGFKINDFIQAGVNCTVFLADWHTLLNDKLGGSFENIRKVSKYYEDAFKLVCPGVNIVLGTDGNVNGSNDTMICYAFAEVQGYSKFGSYEANASADGPFIYTGFKPAWILFKNIDNANNWVLHDNKRGALNVNDEQVSPNNSNVEATDSAKMDFLSNGFKIRGSDSGINGNDGNPYYYVYMCFAQAPLVGSNDVPCTGF